MSHIEERNQLKIELVNHIFDKTYSVDIAPVHLDVAFPTPEPAPTETHDGTYSASGAIVTIDHEGERHVLEALFGNKRYYGVESQDIHTANTPVNMEISMAKMAEVVDTGGRFAIIDPRDSIEMEATLTHYLTLVDQTYIYELHYTGPPKEDLSKLRNLRDSITPLVEAMRAVDMDMAKLYNIEGILTVERRYEGKGKKILEALHNMGVESVNELPTDANPIAAHPKPEPAPVDDRRPEEKPEDQSRQERLYQVRQYQKELAEAQQKASSTPEHRSYKKVQKPNPYKF